MKCRGGASRSGRPRRPSGRIPRRIVRPARHADGPSEGACNP